MSLIKSTNAELQKADPALLNNEALLAAILSANDDCIKILDLEGHLIFMSNGGKRVMEVDDFEPLRGCPWPDFWEGEGKIEAKAAIGTARSGTAARFQGSANTTKGNLRFWDVQVLPIPGSDGHPTHLLSISRDITDEREALRVAETMRNAELAATRRELNSLQKMGQKLRDAELQLKLALDAAELGVWECTVQDGRFINIKEDDRARRLLSRKEGEPVAFEAFSDRIHPDDRAALAIAAQKALDPAGDGILDVEYRMLARSGFPEHWIRARAQAVTDKGATRLVGTVRDITARKSAVARENMLKGELEHRIKNLMAIVGAIATQTFQGDDIAERRERFNARLVALGQAQSALVSDATESANIRETVSMALTPHLNGPDRASINGPDFTMTARQTLSLALAVHELATNAVKYGALSTPTGHIAISWALTPVEDGKLFLDFQWKESGGPPVEQPKATGFGSKLISRALASEFNGEVKVHYRPFGIVCALTATVEKVEN